MDWQNIAAFFGIFATIVVGFYALWTRLDKKFDKIDARFDDLRAEMKEGFADVRRDLKDHGERISRMETKIDERTMRVIYTVKALDEKAI